MTTIKDYMALAQDKLAIAGVDSPGTDAWRLMQHATGWSQPKLLLNLNYALDEVQEGYLNAMMARRLKREPVSRIIGRRGFWKSEFKITPQTLDPRPDSETLVEEALKHVNPAPQAILDLGTGSGCLLLSLLIEWPNAKGVGLDISEEAVNTARENARSLVLSTRAEFVAANWENWQGETQFDVVISNPPYIAESEMAGLAPEVTQYDPPRALLGGRDGLDAYRSIASHIKRWLKPKGWLFLEIGHTQANDVKSLLAEHGFPVIQTVPDLAGSDRVIVSRRP